jgi:protein-S-isoprenylcysteine O-methyltransferase Ste14
MEFSKNTRLVFMLASAVDILLGAAALLIYFSVLPVDISGWGIPRWIVGAVGAVLFFSGIAVFTYFSTKPDVSE